MVAEYPGSAGGAHSVSGISVPEKPVVVHFTLFLRDAADYDGSLWSPERVMIDFD